MTDDGGATTVPRPTVPKPTVPKPTVPKLTVQMLLLLVLLLVGACSGSESPQASSALAGSPQTGGSEATAVASDRPRVASPTTVGAPVSRALRQDDVTDVALLAEAISAGTEGDAEWIAVLAEIRARSWLASRYPGEYEPTLIYSEAWAAETAIVNERQWLELDVYLDEPLPQLLSVVATRQIGVLTELEVTVEAGIAVVRSTADDAPQMELAGGTARGLYTVAQDGPGGRWRVHSVVELHADDDTNVEESNP